MSFDTDFDYTNALTFLDSCITNFNALSAATQTQIDDWAAVTGYSSIASDATTELTAQKANYDAKSAEFQVVKDEITAVTGLSAGDKTTLYDFRAITGEAKSSWMRRMMFNHASILADSDLIALLADATNTSDQKKMVGERICERYLIDSRTHIILSKLPQ